MEPHEPAASTPTSDCLNPCFNGIQMEPKTLVQTARHYLSLNPCFNGIQMEHQAAIEKRNAAEIRQQELS